MRDEVYGAGCINRFWDVLKEDQSSHPRVLSTEAADGLKCT